MKPIQKVLLSILFIAGSMGGACFADPVKASRPATKADLLGVWEVVVVKPVHDTKDPVFYPHQRYVFRKDSSMKSISSEKPLTKEWLEKFEKQVTEIDYRVDEKGVLTMTWQKRSHHETALSAYVLKDVPEELLAKLPPEERSRLPKKGDVTLSFLNSGGKIAYQKVLTRVA